MKRLVLTHADSKDASQLAIAVEALGADQHNPIDWAPVVKLVAPIIARIAVRYALRYVASKTGRRFGKKLPDQTVELAAERVGDIVAKSIPNLSKRRAKK